MDLGLTGHKVLVTAAGGGIGRRIAEAFASEGADVFACDIDGPCLHDLEATAPGVRTAICDVSDFTATELLFRTVQAEFGGLDCLVNNAGIAGPTAPVEEIDPIDWERTFAVNVQGQFNCVRFAVPLLKSSSNASIFNMSSAAGRLGFAMRTPYAASKWAVIGFTKSLAIELGAFRIRVNAILPGIVDGDRQRSILSEKARQRGITIEEMTTIALNRASIPEMVTAKQLADHIVFLASCRARTTSGQAISICADLQSLS